MKREQTKEQLKNLLQTQFGVENPIFIGSGGEGVVFRSSEKVFKCLQRPECWRNEKVYSLLKSLPNRLRGYSSLPEVLDVQEFDNVMIIISRWEECEQEIGECKPEEFLAFLADCREAGIAHNDIRKENFVRKKSGLMLVDLGHDLREIRPDRFHDMAVRTFLVWRYPNRQDLGEIKRECLIKKSHPALIGFDAFIAGLYPYQSLDVYEKMLQEICLKLNGKKVFDYGAGKAKLSQFLKSKGAEVFAYDPAWEKGKISTPENIQSLDRKALSTLIANNEKFDLVLCTRVICEIENDLELEVVLKDLRSLLAPEGRLVLSFCNPFFADVRRTPAELKSGYKKIAEQAFSLNDKILIASQTTRTCKYRRFELINRMLKRAGFFEVEWRENPTSNLDACCYASEVFIGIYKSSPLPAKVSLLLKVCAMEHELVSDFITHMVDQMEYPQAFDERVVIVDNKEKDFTRSYAEADKKKLLANLAQLKELKVIDRIIEAPEEKEIQKELNQRWFGDRANKISSTHSEKGVQNFATFYGIENCRNDLVLAVDSDLLIKRENLENNWLEKVTKIFDEDEKAVFISPSICRNKDEKQNFLDEDGKPFRICSRATLWHLPRLKKILPVDAEVNEIGALKLSWYRLFDQFVQKNIIRAYRVKDAEFGFIHIPNSEKRDPFKLLLKLDRLEAGYIPEEQDNNVELVENELLWLQPKREEHYIIFVTGRNISCGIARNCIESILNQDRSDFGIVIFDDASENQTPIYLKKWLEKDSRITLVRNRRRMRSLFNHYLAIHKFCSNPDSIVVTLDMDDVFVNSSVLSRLENEYSTGADMTVGSMFGSDKKRIYLPDFAEPRSRKNNLWQHLRSFKKYLFDAIPKEYFIFNNEWIEYAADWAYMIPIAEQSSSPRYIKDILYFYNANHKTEKYRQERDEIIAQILKQKPMARKVDLNRVPLISVIGDAGISVDDPKCFLAEKLGDQIMKSNWRLLTGGMTGIMSAASKGARLSKYYKSGSVVAVIPTLDPNDATPYADIVLATGLGDYRNGIIANADAIIVVGGGAGTLSEIAFAWMRRRLIIALQVDGWSSKVAGIKIDDRPRKVGTEEDCVFSAKNVEEVIELLSKYLPLYQKRPKGFAGK